VKTCWLLLWFDALNFKNFTKLVWLDLKEFCKRFGNKSENQKGKEENEIKIEKGQGAPFRPTS
jgi:hypothetical protein